jgi:tRNA nucleotidyltransferase (CCA-adding enzyme)
MKRLLQVLIDIPKDVSYIIKALEKAGFEAYVVGGCVRDAIRGAVPSDWDICTNALPHETMSCFLGHSIIETGLKHGTITLALEGRNFEITTYRIDGEYSDSRHPGEVTFVSNLKEELSRRDFTINAIAYNPSEGIIDYYGGREDIQRRLVRTVGNPDERFSEDALRIMRALRFSSALGYDIEEKTSESILRNKHLLANISRERISEELSKLITGDRTEELLTGFVSVFTEIIPEIEAMVGFDQYNPWHHLDVWQHTAISVSAAPADTYVRLTMLFHDIAKPKCYTETDGIGHFYGHPAVSAGMAKDILTRLKYDNKTIDIVTQLTLYHDYEITPRKRVAKKLLSKIGEEQIRRLIEVKRADNIAQEESRLEHRLSVLGEFMEIVEAVIEENECFSLKDLAVSGRDIMSVGVPEGQRVGQVLNQLLEMVINEEIQNEKDKLLFAVPEIANRSF